MPADGSAPPTQLVYGSESVNTFELTPDGQRVLLLKGSTGLRLWSVPVDGSAPPLELSGPMVAGGSIGGGGEDRIIQSPDGLWVAFVADKESVDVNELYVVRVDGSAGPIKLNAPNYLLHSAPLDASSAPVELSGLPVGLVQLVSAYGFSSGGAAVLFLRHATGRDELHVVPLDGSSPSVLLSGASQPSGNVTDFRVSADDEFVVFRGDLLADERHELFRAALDGSTARVRVSDPVLGSTTGRSVERDFALTPDGLHVVYPADRDADEVQELYCGPSDGSALPLELNPPLEGAAYKDVLDFALTPDGEYVVYRSNQDNPATWELFRVSRSGGQATRLSEPFLPLGAVKGVQPGYRITSAGRVVYRSDQAVEHVMRLWSVAADGSSQALRLEGAQVSGSVLEFLLRGEGGRVLFRRIVGTRTELFSVRMDGAWAPIRISPALDGGRAVGQVSVSSDGRRVVYVADQEADNVQELFLSMHGSGEREQQAPAPSGTVYR